VGAEDRSGTQTRPHAPPGCGCRIEPKTASQPLGSGRLGGLAGSGAGSSGAGSILRAGTVAARFGVRRQKRAVGSWDALPLRVGGADLRVSRLAKSEGRLGLRTEFLGAAAAGRAARTEDQRAGIKPAKQPESVPPRRRHPAQVTGRERRVEAASVGPELRDSEASGVESHHADGRHRKRQIVRHPADSPAGE